MYKSSSKVGLDTYLLLDQILTCLIHRNTGSFNKMLKLSWDEIADFLL